MTTFGGLSAASHPFAAACSSPICRSFQAAFAVAVARLTLVRPGARRWRCPAWVHELGRQYVWDGFPVGAARLQPGDRVLPVAQLASITGVYGLSLLLALTGAALLSGRRITPATGAVGGRWRRSCCRRRPLWGAARETIAAAALRQTPVRVAVLQANIAQDDKWDPLPRRRLRMPLPIDVAPGARPAARRSSCGRNRRRPSSSTTCCAGPPSGGWREGGATLLIGSDQIEPVATTATASRTRYYNAAFLVKPTGASARSTARCTSCRSANTCRCSRCCSSWADRRGGFGLFPGPRPCCCRSTGTCASTAICYEVIFRA